MLCLQEPHELSLCPCILLHLVLITLIYNALINSKLWSYNWKTKSKNNTRTSNYCFYSKTTSITTTTTTKRLFVRCSQFKTQERRSMQAYKRSTRYPRGYRVSSSSLLRSWRDIRGDMGFHPYRYWGHDALFVREGGFPLIFIRVMGETWPCHPPAQTRNI